MSYAINLYLDCEYNDFKGELISMALVGEDGREWYEVLGCDKPSEWVRANVMPVLNQEPVTREEMQSSLQLFLSEYDEITIISDWPEDIQHFCEMLITGAGRRIATGESPILKLVIDRGLSSSESEVPHNALSDARALMLHSLDMLY